MVLVTFLCRGCSRFPPIQQFWEHPAAHGAGWGPWRPAEGLGEQREAQYHLPGSGRWV